MIVLSIIKFVMLSVAIAYGFGNIVRGFRGAPISGFQMWAMGICAAGFIVLQFCL